MHRLIMTLLLALATLPTQVLGAGDAAKGKVKAYTCTGCHGIPGYNNVYPTFKVPKIGGQNYEYIVAALIAYQQGDRKHGTMNSQAMSLTEADISDIAAYFSALGHREAE